ncbi:MAG: DUF3566 domain-containing protein, partial [Candidatus Latescibacterota bacterium]
MEPQLEVRKIDLWSVFKISFFLYAVLGLLFGLIYAFFMMLVGSMNSAILGEELEGFGFLTGIFGLFMIPFMAFVYGIFGSVSTTICCWVYNVIAGLSGGVRFEMSPVVRMAPVAPPVQSPAPQAEAPRPASSPPAPGSTTP